jgi:hypothetical protein
MATASSTMVGFVKDGGDWDVHPVYLPDTGDHLNREK